ncbi:uncharacterized protein LOC106172737 [Lingula anatina]|uniref:Uncharacterized protein LOC106172737 n=1 Tax=Lingula anatina TaxID=7574 RepID=A0A1S3JGK6_LINAN|nr:uncharacterized protein LOC106172737 [Lingula anatina]|eukprot:XP_013409029.1 uncharacterized protein LOC106172737 [Lingula anatina]
MEVTSQLCLMKLYVTVMMYAVEGRFVKLDASHSEVQIKCSDGFLAIRHVYSFCCSQVSGGCLGLTECSINLCCNTTSQHDTICRLMEWKAEGYQHTVITFDCQLYSETVNGIKSAFPTKIERNICQVRPNTTMTRKISLHDETTSRPTATIVSTGTTPLRTSTAQPTATSSLDARGVFEVLLGCGMITVGYTVIIFVILLVNKRLEYEQKRAILAKLRRIRYERRRRGIQLIQQEMDNIHKGLEQQSNVNATAGQVLYSNEYHLSSYEEISDAHIYLEPLQLAAVEYDDTVLNSQGPLYDEINQFSGEQFCDTAVTGTVQINQGELFKYDYVVDRESTEVEEIVDTIQTITHGGDCKDLPTKPVIKDSYIHFKETNQCEERLVERRQTLPKEYANVSSYEHLVKQENCELSEQDSSYQELSENIQ